MAAKKAKTKPDLSIVKKEGASEQGKDTGEHKKIRDEVLALRDRAESSSWELAEKLRDVFDNNYYLKWGYAKWRDYIEQEIGIQMRKAQILVQLSKWFDGLPKNVKDWIKSLGWSKAKILVRFVTPANAAEWRKKVGNKTLAEIEQMLTDAKQGKSGEGEGTAPDSTTKVTLAFFPEQHKNFKIAIEKAKEMGAESEKVSHLVDLICTEFLATNAGMKDRRDYLISIEKTLGLKIVALDEEKDEVVFGSELVDTISKEEDSKKTKGGGKK